ncbi:hypothetical protein ACHAP5_011111, partial [Fusarium lateritium]
LHECCEFEALSYVWGDRDGCQLIEVNRQSFLVTKNLSTALHHLRRATKPRTLWIDAICIDQADANELSAQVAIMDQIYHCASLVISWLGLTDPLFDPVEEMRYAQDFLRHIRFLHDHAPFREYLAKEGAQTPYADLADQAKLFNIGLWSFQLLIGERKEQPWYWKRAWITQEVVKARSWILQVGPQTISDEDVKAVGRFLGLPSINLVMEGRYEERVLRARIRKTSTVPISIYRSLLDPGYRVQESMVDPRLRDSGPWPLLDLLRRNRSRLCLDPRDKVYSVLKISDLASIDHPGLFIDYKLSISQVYIGAVQAAIELSSSLDVLCSAKLAPSTQALSLPSWVPNWNEEKRPEEAEQPISFGHQTAANGTLADWHFSTDSSGGHILTAKGLRFGTVTDLKDRFVNLSPEIVAAGDVTGHLSIYHLFHRQFHSIFKWMSQAIKPQQLSPETFCRTCAVGLLDHVLDDSFQELMEELCLTLKSEDTEVRPMDPTKVAGFGLRYRTMMSAIDGQCLFTVQPTILAASSAIINGEGVFGIASTGIVKRGDFLCLLLGCSAPLILRPTGEGRVVVVCAAYIDCLMNGRAMECMIQAKFNLETYIIE